MVGGGGGGKGEGGGGGKGVGGICTGSKDSEAESLRGRKGGERGKEEKNKWRKKSWLKKE